MTLSVRASISAMAPGRRTSFQAYGGAEPYAYSVVPGGAGGAIDPATGLYTADAVMNPDPKLNRVQIRATDSLGAVADSSPILVADPLFLFCEIIQKELGLAADRVWIFDQKRKMPIDSGLFVIVHVTNLQPFGNNVKYDGSGSGLDAIQSVNVKATLTLNIMSRSTEALIRKEEVLMAITSPYAESQMELNSFYIGRLPPGAQFVNLSELDGAAIPYRFNLSVNMHYFVKKTRAAAYFDQFAAPQVVTEP